MALAVPLSRVASHVGAGVQLGPSQLKVMGSGSLLAVHFAGCSEAAVADEAGQGLMWPWRWAQLQLAWGLARRGWLDRGE